MKLLVIGSGGREHALAWKLARTPGLQKVYVAPGNAGTARELELENVDISAPEALADFVEKEGIHLTVVGPEAPLAAGVVNVFRARGLKIFGPTKEAAQLESSKDFAKRFMAKHGIPTAAFATFTDADEAHAYVEAQGAPIVIKADGLAAGKGVVVAMTLAEAHPELIRFILNAQSDGLRLVLVITGKGKGVADPVPRPIGALRHQVPHWLRLPPLALSVQQVAEAHLKHGGSGAFYVYLRRR